MFKYTQQVVLLAFLGLTLFCSTPSFGQSSYLISGKIISDEDSRGMPGVQVRSSDGGGTISQADGGFSLPMTDNSGTLEFRMVGFEKVILNVSRETASPLRVILKSETQLLEQIVISASRFEQNVAEVTMSMEVIGPQLIQNRNITALDNLLRETPGVIIVDEEPQIRSGSGYSFGAGSRVQVLLDGIPQLSGDVGRPAWSNIPMEAVEQVEVIKGASSVLYGSSALSGVVHVRSTFPKGKPITKIDAYGGAYAGPDSGSNNYWGAGNMIQGRTIMHAQQIGNADIVVSLDLLSDDGHLGQMVDSLGSPIPVSGADDPGYFDAERRARAWIKYRYRNQKIPGLIYGLQANGQKNVSVATLLWDNAETGLFKAFQGSATTTHQTVSNLNPYIEYRNDKGHSVLWRGNWNRLDNENDNNQDNFSDTYFNELQVQLNGESFGLNGLRSTLGLNHTRAKSESQLFNNNGQDPEHKSSNKGAYLQLDHEVNERMHASAGIRWEEFEVDGEKESQPVFRTGLNYRFGKATYLRASYGQGYRFPTIGERYISTAVGVLNIYPNPDLTSETSANIELGVKQGLVLGEFKGYLDLALFKQDFENFIEFTFGQWADTAAIDNLFGLGFTSLNTGKAVVKGAELSLAATGSISKKSKLSILAGYTYTAPITKTPNYIYAESDLSNNSLEAFEEVSYLSSSSNPKNDVLKYRMQHLARMNIDFQTGRYNLGMGVRYNSFMQNIDGIFEELDDGDALGGLLPTGVSQWRRDNNKGDIVLDLRTGYTFYNEHSVSLVIDNLLNRHYAIRPLALEQTRRVVVRLSFRF